MRNDDPAHVVVRNDQREKEQATKPLPTCERCGREMQWNKMNQVSLFMSRGTAHGRKLCDECAWEMLKWIDLHNKGRK